MPKWSWTQWLPTATAYTALCIATPCRSASRQWQRRATRRATRCTGWGRLLIVGDLIHGFDLQIQDLDICPDYDMNPRQAAETRKKYVEYARQNSLFVAGMHFPGNGVKDKL